jgi:hypothetical protein
MSNMKRNWDEQLDSDLEKVYREAGITQETLERMAAWIKNSAVVKKLEEDNCNVDCADCACRGESV